MSGQFDKTLDPLDEVFFRNRAEDLIRENKWVKNTHFNAKELVSILFMFYKIQRENGKGSNFITFAQFSKFFDVALGIPDDFLQHRIFHELVGSASNMINAHTWIKTMNLFLRGTMEEKIQYCYGVYDPPQQGIRREHMMKLLRRAIFKHDIEDIEENVKGLVDLILSKIDLDRDGKVSFDDYRQSVLKEPHLLECMGQCLPDRTHVNALLTTFTDRIKKF